MRKVLALALFGIGSGVVAMAAVPEIDPASAGSAVALLAGTILIFRGRRKK
jgi:ABC-type anion transport system duplicated permease subunit